ncbi:hypothetical protein FSOLCH5_003250 [Fusarium solani]
MVRCDGLGDPCCSRCDEEGDCEGLFLDGVSLFGRESEIPFFTRRRVEQLLDQFTFSINLKLLPTKNTRPHLPPTHLQLHPYLSIPTSTMGNNLSSTFIPDTSKVVLSPEDRASAIKLGIFWAASLYGCAVIFSTCALVDRWKGPFDKNYVGFSSVMAALLLSTCWPVVMTYLFLSQGSL